MKLYGTKQHQNSVPKTGSKSDELSLLRQSLDLLQNQQSKTASQKIGQGTAWLFKQIAGHVLMLLLGATAVGWWMTQDDSWKSYINTGCNPDPILYTKRFPPQPPPDKPTTWQELTEWQRDYIAQLLLVNSQLNLDRDSVRAACSR